MAERRVSTVSIQLSSELATAACESCGRSASVSTTDSGLLVMRVREFLELHWSCSSGNASQGRTKALMVAQRRPSDDPEGRIV